MLEDTILQWLVTQAGLAGIAALSIIILNRVWADRTNSELARRAEEREDKLALLQAYQDNAAAMKEISTAISQHTATIQRLCSVIERMEKGI